MNLCFALSHTNVSKQKVRPVLLPLRFFTHLVLFLALSSLVVACAQVRPDTPEAGKVPVDVLSGDSVPLDPEVNADPTDTGLEQLTDEELMILESKNGLFFDLDQHNNETVEHFFAYFTHKARKTFAIWLERSEPYIPHIREMFIKNGLPQDLVLLPFAESGYNVRAYSRAGAAGLWQFMPYTGRKYGLTVDWWVDERRDPYLATGAAISYLSDLHDIFGDWYLALAAYNAGEGKIARALKLSGATTFFELVEKNNTLPKKYRLKRETIQYVPKFIAISKIFQNLEELGFEPVCWDNALAVEHIEVPGGTDLLALAKAGDMKWSEFHDLNPFYKRQVAPPGDTTTCHLPDCKVESVQAYLADPKSRPYEGYIRYVVKNGDSWWNISRKYGIPISVLKKVNNKNSNLLKPGQTVMVPGHGGSKPVMAASADGSKPKPKAQVVKGKKVYTVRANDTLWAISQAFGVNVNDLKQVNGLNNSRKLQVGQKLAIPEQAGTSQSAVAQAKPVQAKAVQATPASVSTSPSKGGTYTVRSGDTLWDISRNFGVSVDAIKAANGLGSSKRLQVGQKLTIPGGSGGSVDTQTASAVASSDTQREVSYEVRSGDTMWSIAGRFGVSLTDLRKWNNMGSSNRIYPGQELKVYAQ